MWVQSEIALGKAWQCDRVLFWLVSCTAGDLGRAIFQMQAKHIGCGMLFQIFESQLDMGQLDTFGMMWINIWLVGLDENTYAGSFHFSKNLFQIYLPSFL